MDSKEREIEILRALNYLETSYDILDYITNDVHLPRTDCFCFEEAQINIKQAKNMLGHFQERNGNE